MQTKKTRILETITIAQHSIHLIDQELKKRDEMKSFAIIKVEITITLNSIYICMKIQKNK